MSNHNTEPEWKLPGQDWNLSLLGHFRLLSLTSYTCPLTLALALSIFSQNRGASEGREPGPQL